MTVINSLEMPNVLKFNYIADLWPLIGINNVILMLKFSQDGLNLT